MRDWFTALAGAFVVVLSIGNAVIRIRQLRQLATLRHVGVVVQANIVGKRRDRSTEAPDAFWVTAEWDLLGVHRQDFRVPGRVFDSTELDVRVDPDNPDSGMPVVWSSQPMWAGAVVVFCLVGVLGGTWAFLVGIGAIAAP